MPQDHSFQPKRNTFFALSVFYLVCVWPTKGEPITTDFKTQSLEPTLVSHEHTPLLAKLANYSKSIDRLKARALLQGSLSYQQVIDLTYARGVVNSNVLRTKREWRKHIGNSGWFFISDYSKSKLAAEISCMAVIQDSQTNSATVARYNAWKNVVEISNNAGSGVMLHEAGHILQRIATCGSPYTNKVINLKSALAVTSEDETTAFEHSENRKIDRILYLTSQQEFEIRLQDLNRFYSLVSERPMTTKAQALEALMLLGIPVGESDEEPLFSGEIHELFFHGFELKNRLSPFETIQCQIVFEDAYELKALRELVLEVKPSLWPVILLKIVMEAPGHF